MYTGSHIVTLRDRDVALLGTLTVLGSAGAPGSLIVSNSLTYSTRKERGTLTDPVPQSQTVPTDSASFTVDTTVQVNSNVEPVSRADEIILPR